ncbi:MAG: ATP-dependent sacrificial sulfur transferase LarE [Deltaproteobacteria bacterium]|nr:MAG: ATP-dependent sacrificial sulfur transferase LarE [Deltaproteobacteria bacterium]
MQHLPEKRRQLKEILEGLGSVLVCFSGGVDSAYLLSEAIDCLGPARAVAFTAVSPSLAASEKAAAERIAGELGARLVLHGTHELDDARYARNPLNRCYFCKRTVFTQAWEIARREGLSAVVDGFNRDDRSDHTPGHAAALERGVRSPLDEAGFTKAEIRQAAREKGLSVWNKPALACLASRFPYGTAITRARLEQVARCEAFLRACGFRVVRVRYHGDLARIEVGLDELHRFESPDLRATVQRAFEAQGFRRVEVDPRGYRRGALNTAHRQRPGSLGCKPPAV